MNVHDIGTFVSDVVDEYGYFVDRNYCGHGIGKLFHCNPTIPHTRSRVDSRD
jgi:methionine aminopeptidase 1